MPKSNILGGGGFLHSQDMVIEGCALLKDGSNLVLQLYKIIHLAMLELAK